MMAAVEAGPAGAVAAPVRGAVAGAAMPQIGSCVRARWSHLVPDKAQLQTAFAFESVVDESVFILGPALVTVLATAVHPLAGLGCAVRRHPGRHRRAGRPSSAPSRRRPARGRGAGPGRSRGGCSGRWSAARFAMGVLLGGAEVATVAFADEHGATALVRPAARALGAGQPARRAW